MGDFETMQSRIDSQLAKGFQTLKMKVGAIDFDKECQLLKKIRARYAEKDLTIRVDANGAFKPSRGIRKIE